METRQVLFEQMQENSKTPYMAHRKNKNVSWICILYLWTWPFCSSWFYLGNDILKSEHRDTVLVRYRLGIVEVAYECQKP